MMLDFNQVVDFKQFSLQVENILKDRSLMLQIAFDVFDTNGDGKISQLDIFKVFYQICKGPIKDKFG